MANLNAACRALRQINAVARSSRRSSRAAGSGPWSFARLLVTLASLCEASELWPQDEGHKGNRSSRNPLTHVNQNLEISNKADGPANACAPENCDRHQTYEHGKPPMRKIMIEGSNHFGGAAGRRLSIAGVSIDNLVRFVLHDDGRVWIVRPARREEFIYHFARGLRSRFRRSAQLLLADR